MIMGKIDDLDNTYSECGHWDCVFVDVPLSKGPCLWCTEYDTTTRESDESNCKLPGGRF